MSNNQTNVTPIVCTVREGFIQILFEGMKPLEFNRPKVAKDSEKENPEVVAFDEFAALIQDENWDAVLESLRPNNDIGSIISDDISTEGLTIEKGRVKFQGFVVKSKLASKIIGMVADANRKGEKVSDLSELKTLVVFLSRVLHNSDNKVVNDLFNFVESNNVMVDNKGNMQTLYVVVDKDGKSGKHDLSGSTWSMPSNMIDCSNALVVYSRVGRKPPEGHKVVRVMVNPSDVVTVGNVDLVVCSLTVKESVVDDNWED
jgi:hypothetical protein